MRTLILRTVRIHPPEVQQNDPPLLASTLSFAAMLEEARSAESDADFISKCCIGLKEARESWTRMRVCQRCRIGTPPQVSAPVVEGNELIAIVTTIIKHKRRTVATKRAAEKARRRARPANHEFQIPNS
jgi:four helix bundle protein